MLGMKRDCGGAAGILGAFRAAVKQVSLKSVTLSKPPFLLCNSSFQVKCLLVAMWRWEHNAFVGLNSMTVIVFYFKSTRGLLYMHSPKNKNKTRKTIVLTYHYTGTSNVDVFSRPPPLRTPPPPHLKKNKNKLSRSSALEDGTYMIKHDDQTTVFSQHWELSACMGKVYFEILCYVFSQFLPCCFPSGF